MNNIQKSELLKFKNGEWANLQKICLGYKSESERLSRLNELDKVKYEGCTLIWETRFFDEATLTLNDVGVGCECVLSCWQIKKIVR
jgi:hypothetical protein